MAPGVLDVSRYGLHKVFGNSAQTLAKGLSPLEPAMDLTVLWVGTVTDNDYFEKTGDFLHRFSSPCRVPSKKKPSGNSEGLSLNGIQIRNASICKHPKV